jgi:hypothetical protein
MDVAWGRGTGYWTKSMQPRHTPQHRKHNLAGVGTDVLTVEIPTRPAVAIPVVELFLRDGALPNGRDEVA